MTTVPTPYGIQHVGGTWLADGGLWVANHQRARVFDSFDDAEKVALREVSLPRDRWSVKVVIAAIPRVD